MKSDIKWCDTQYGKTQIHPTAGRATVLTPVQSNVQSSRHTMTTLIYRNAVLALKDLNSLQPLRTLSRSKNTWFCSAPLTTNKFSKFMKKDSINRLPNFSHQGMLSKTTALSDN